MINWPVFRKILIVLLSSIVAALIIIDLVPREFIFSGPEVLLSAPQVNVPKNKRYNEEIVEQERQMSEYNLNRIDLIVKANSDPLPQRFFNASADEMCNNSTSLRCLPKFKRIETRIRLAPPYKLMTCIIQKSMSTVMAAIMCMLQNETAFIGAGREFAKECGDVRFCLRKHEYTSVASMKRRFNVTEHRPKDWIYTMITRDPVERFLSGYLDKCIRYPRQKNYCNGCERNMTCFIITEYERMVNQLVVGKFARTFEDMHFFPQSWRCDLHREYENYRFIRYSSDPSELLLTDLIPILREKKVPESSIDFIRNELSQGRTVHSTHQFEAREFLEKRLKSSPFLLEYVIRMFYYDFKLFNHPFPKGF